MKSCKKVFGVLSATALLFGSVAAVNAAQINGNISFFGGVNLDTSSSGTATQVTHWSGFGGVGSPIVADVTGDFASFVTPGDSAIFQAPWSFNSGPIASFWTVDGFKFDLTSSAVISQTASPAGLIVGGAGTISGNGFDATPGVWSFTSQDPGAGTPPTFSFSASGDATPTACNCTLTFNSPSSITNCASDVIPDITAIQVCDGGLSNVVATTFVGASTNGSCPKIIVRTNSAMDSCGNVQTFVQTITVNCAGSICGHVFGDCDGSGDLTAGDVGLSKVIVSLLSGNKVLTSIMTDSNGGYCFTNLAGGTYVVAVTPPSGYSQTAASTSYHWKDSYGRDCWGENDGYIHCKSGGTECWWDKSNNCHWKDSYGRDCWKDNWGGNHCQPCNYQSCNAQTNNNKITVTLTNCTSQGDVDFAYTGGKPSLSVCVSGPSYVRCGQTCTYTCTITNTGNVCFNGGTVCHTIGNCNYWGGWNGCNNYNTTCPPLAPGEHCTITQKCSFNSWNCGTVACQSTVNCKPRNGGSYCQSQSTCYSQCGW